MTTEKKAPTAEDVKRWDEAIHNSLEGGARFYEALPILQALVEAALLGVQVPGLREELRLRSKALEAAQEVSALQARVAELTRERDDFRKELDGLGHAFDTEQGIAQRALTERDALHAQVERVRILAENATKEGMLPSLRATFLAALSTPPAEEKKPEPMEGHGLDETDEVRCEIDFGPWK